MSSESFLDPGNIIKQLEVAKGSTVADFGCGSGFFSLAFAEAIGGDGRVFSLDVLPSALESVASKAKLAGLFNVIPQRVNLEREGGSKLPSGSIDWVIMKDVLFQNKMKDVIMKEASRVLKNGGKLLAVEWNDQNTPAGLGPDKKIRISKGELDQLAEAQKFIKEKDLVAGDFHHGAVYKK
jgi:ubiquinone/menaquinone biosynthesis C-methylase UbiE